MQADIKLMCLPSVEETGQLPLRNKVGDREGETAH